jgi:hypothetical protein
VFLRKKIGRMEAPFSIIKNSRFSNCPGSE